MIGGRASVARQLTREIRAPHVIGLRAAGAEAKLVRGRLRVPVRAIRTELT
jgi:hypothetical protein